MRQDRVTDGVLAANDPAVVGLMVGGQITCTGVLVSPHAVLTAAHCMVNSLPDAALVGLSASEGEPMAALMGFLHPGYRVGSPDHDLGVLVLHDGIDADRPALSQALVTDAEAGRDLRIVGFGRVSPDDTSAPRKMQGMTILDAFSPLTLSLKSDPSQPCAGDSGGPALALVGGQEIVVGIIAAGDEACASGARAVRVDAHRSDFIEPLIARVEGTSMDMGERCVFDGNCSSSLCLSPEDAPSFAYCSRACADDKACIPGMECRERSSGERICQYRAPSPGAIGAPCARGDECQLGMCSTFAEGSGLICSALCFPEDASPCPSGAECTPIVGEAGVFGCAPRDDKRSRIKAVGGCGVGGASTPSQGGLVAMLLLGGVSALRRRRVHLS